MHVIELRAENYKRLVAVEVAPTGSVFEVAGKNAQGKSSLLESMLVALCGEGAIPAKPIRRGETAASVRVKLGDDKPTLIVTRTFAAKEDGGYTTKLVVEAADGARYAKPQTMLDDLVGALAFDPLAFTRMKPREQLEQLRALVPGVDFNALEQANRGDFERRTDVNRQVRAARARLDALQVPGDPRHERVDEAALVAELEAAGRVAAEIEKERARRQDLMRDVRRTQADAQNFRSEGGELALRIQSLEAELAELKKRVVFCAESAVRHADAASRDLAAIEALPPLAIAPDTTEIKQRIAAARGRNREIDDRERVINDRDRISKEIQQAEAQAATYKTRIEERNKQAADAIGAAKLPIEGLGFGDDMVLLNGLPFAQASSAEQLRVSVAIAAAMSPKLKVAHVRDGSLLDEDSMELLRQLAEHYGFQVWVERVASDSPVGIVIEDGRVRAAEEVAA